MYITDLETALETGQDPVPGWFIFPVMGKRPVVDHWPETAAADLETRRRLAQVRHDGWAVAAGPSNLFIVDLDWHSADENGLSTWTGLVGAVKSPVWGRSPSGGVHLYWADPGAAYGPRVGLLPALDIRSQRSYVVFVGPGRELHVEVWGFPPVPAPVLEAYARPEAPVRHEVPVRRDRSTGDRKLRALEGACDAVRAAAKGKRNHMLNWAAYRAGRPAIAAGVPVQLVFDLLLQAGLDADQDVDEAGMTIESGLGIKGLR